MARFLTDFTDDAKADLAWFTAPERRTIVAGIREQLAQEPAVKTRNRKPVRDEPSRWELRIGRYRVFYEVSGG